jgi:hypothetical protein
MPLEGWEYWLFVSIGSLLNSNVTLLIRKKMHFQYVAHILNMMIKRVALLSMQ